MNRRNFLRMAASAAAGLVVPRVGPEPKYTDADVDRIVEENESLRRRAESIREWAYTGYGILKDISRHLRKHGFQWAVYWRDLADQVESLCIERDELKRRVEMYEDALPPYVRIGDASDLEDIPGLSPSVDFRRLYPSSDDVAIYWGVHGYADTKGENDAEETDPV